MITIDSEVCSGCAACVEVCPSGAIYLVEGKATVDGTLCHDCEACFAACPTGAITFAAPDERAAQPAHLPSRWPEGDRRSEGHGQTEVHRQPELEVIQVQAPAAPAPSPSRALPVVGAALAWAGREIVPWLADLALDALDRRASRRRLSNGEPRREAPASRAQGGGRQHRRRRRGREG